MTGLLQEVLTGRSAPSLAIELGRVVRDGALWAVNTGRSLKTAIEGLEGLGAPGEPDYILTSERHLYRGDGTGGWHDYGDGNRICREHHNLLFRQCGTFFGADPQHDGPSRRDSPPETRRVFPKD